MKASAIGFFSFAYPEQKMKERIDHALNNLKLQGIEINFCGYVIDHDESSQIKAKEKLNSSSYDSDCLILIISSWIESPPVIRVISDQTHLPILLWSLSAYRTDAGLIAPAGAAGATGLNFILKVFGAKHISLYDEVDKESKFKEAAEFVRFSHALKVLKNSRVASIGYSDMNLYSLMYDGTLIKKFTGIHVDNLDLYDIYAAMEKVTKKEINNFIENFLSKVQVVNKLKNQDLETLAKSFIAVNNIIQDKNYKGITLKCVLGMSKWFNFSPCMLESLIGDEVETICECDVYGMINQLIIKELTGTKATFLEFYEFYENSILMGACGFAPLGVCNTKKMLVQGHDWGQAGGIMNVSELNTSDKITLTKLYTVNGQMHLHCLKGSSKIPELWQEDGWDGKGPKMPSLEIFIDEDLKEFQEYIAGQHYIVCFGDFYELLKRYCKFSGIRFNEHKNIDFSYK